MSALGLGRVKTPTPAARRNIFDKLRVIRTDNTADIRLDAMLENYIFYISRMYEFSHSLGHKRTNHRGPKSIFDRGRDAHYCAPPAVGWDRGADRASNDADV